MAELRLLLLDLETEREGDQHVGEHVHHAQRQYHADGSLQVTMRASRQAMTVPLLTLMVLVVAFGAEVGWLMTWAPAL